MVASGVGGRALLPGAGVPSTRRAVAAAFGLGVCKPITRNTVRCATPTSLAKGMELPWLCEVVSASPSRRDVEALGPAGVVVVAPVWIVRHRRSSARSATHTVSGQVE